MKILPPPSTYKLLAASAVAIPHTGSVNETVLATVPIPAGVMGLNGRLLITTMWSYTNSANSKTLRARLGGIGGTAFLNVGVTATALAQILTIIRNVNAQNVQKGWVAATTSAFTSSTATLAAGALDTSVEQSLVFTAQLATAAETITLEDYMVEVVRL